MRKLSLLLLTLSLTFMLGACGKEETAVAEPVIEAEPIVVEEEEEEVVEEEVVEEEVVVEDVVPEGMYRSELTNEIIDESLQNQRPIAAMVDNELTALPHYGLNEADVVYEMMNSTLNGRITRLMVLVKDWAKIERLGSIRSVRPTNILLAAEWNAVLCHDGGPYYIDQYINKDYMDNFSGTFDRIDNGKSREFTEYIATGNLERNFKNAGLSTEYNECYEGPHFQFATEANPIDFSDIETALSANNIKLPFEHNGSYLEYDTESGLYGYGEYGDPHLDGATGEQLKFKNVILQQCTFSQLDEHGYMIFNVIDHGKVGYYITNGKAVPITWVKDSESGITRYYDSNEQEITINTGKTYIGLVPDDNWADLLIQ